MEKPQCINLNSQEYEILSNSIVVAAEQLGYGVTHPTGYVIPRSLLLDVYKLIGSGCSQASLAVLLHVYADDLDVMREVIYDILHRASPDATVLRFSCGD